MPDVSTRAAFAISNIALHGSGEVAEEKVGFPFANWSCFPLLGGKLTDRLLHCSVSSSDCKQLLNQRWLMLQG